MYLIKKSNLAETFGSFDLCFNRHLLSEESSLLTFCYIYVPPLYSKGFIYCFIVYNLNDYLIVLSLKSKTRSAQALS